MIVGSLSCLGRRVVLFLVHSDGCILHMVMSVKNILRVSLIATLSMCLVYAVQTWGTSVVYPTAARLYFFQCDGPKNDFVRRCNAIQKCRLEGNSALGDTDMPISRGSQSSSGTVV